MKTRWELYRSADGSPNNEKVVLEAFELICVALALESLFIELDQGLTESAVGWDPDYGKKDQLCRVILGVRLKLEPEFRAAKQ